jgi:hypothetical protein
VKFALIAATVWYGFAMYYSAQDLMGWPASRALPAQGRIIAVRIDEPDRKKNDAGMIYLWIHEEKEGDGFFGGRKSEPRAYRIPYNKEMHKALLDAQRGMEGIPGAQIRIKNEKGEKGKRGKGKSQGGEYSYDQPKFEIINPADLIPKS